MPAPSSPPPPARTPLLGREADLARVEAVRGRVVVVTGPPGVGKTRLAIEMARRTPPAVWVDASRCRSAQDLDVAVANALAVPPRGDLARALAARGDALLVVDAAERLAPGARDRLLALADGAPAARVVVTSIVRLGLDGEVDVELAPLDDAAAVALFEARGRDAGASLRDEDRPVACELVRRLDRMPLAIELAAARLDVLSPRRILAKVTEDPRLLSGGRHGSIEGAIAFAWELLDDDERRALAWCSVFRGGLDAAAAERVVPGARPLDLLRSLRHKSLVQRCGERFELLAAVRDFAEARLAASGERDEAVERHARAMVEEGERRVGKGSRAESPEALAWLRVERDNLLAAAAGARDPDLAARAALVLRLVLALAGPVGLAGKVLDDALARVRDATLRARLLRVRADVHLHEGRLDLARARLDEALAGRDELPTSVRGQLLTDSGRLHALTGDVDAGRAELAEAIRLHTADGDDFLTGFALNASGILEEAAGRATEAVRWLEAALDHFRRCDHARLQSVVTINLAVLASQAGRPADALHLLERALQLLREVGDRSGEGAALVNLGHLHLVAGRIDDAEAALRAALTLERELGHRDFEGLALGNLGLAAALRGELRAARDTLQQTLDHFKASGDRRYHPAFRAFFAAVEAALGHADEARADLATARADHAGDAGHLAVCDVLEGVLELAGRGDLDDRLASARARLDAAPTSGDGAIARQLLERALLAVTAGSSSPAQDAAPTERGLVVGPEGTWCALDGARIDLSRRGPARRILLALVEHRWLAPGAGLDPERLFAAGWPGERALPEAARNRVYAAVRSLRALGLEAVLLRRDDGYLLAPEVAVHRATPAPPPRA